MARLSFVFSRQGGRFRINVVDKLTDRTMLKTTSIVSDHSYVTLCSRAHLEHQHWHGLFQKGTNWADGPSFINQCPIASGNSFLYDFPTLDQVKETLKDLVGASSR